MCCHGVVVLTVSLFPCRAGGGPGEGETRTCGGQSEGEGEGGPDESLCPRTGVGPGERPVAQDGGHAAVQGSPCRHSEGSAMSRVGSSFDVMCFEFSFLKR